MREMNIMKRLAPAQIRENLLVRQAIASSSMLQIPSMRPPMPNRYDQKRFIRKSPNA